jgi:DNA invertase Pin-like site-specific DNA recombinase
MRKKCLIWNRVSTKEQQHALEGQVKACKELANDLGFENVVFHTPVSESAKVAGKEFKAMLKKLKDPRNGFDGIIVEYLDRFSRNVPVATKEIRDLADRGIYFYTSVENLNTEGRDDLYRADILFSRAEQENHLRSIKTKRASRHWVEQGYITHKAPVGYAKDTSIPKDDVRSKEIFPTNDAPLIKLGFEMLNQGKLIKDIATEITSKGLNLTSKRWGEVFRNYIYSGRIKSKLLDFKIVNGRHKGIVSVQLFESVQKRLKKNTSSNKIKTTNDSDVFLKGNLRCECCDSKMTSYSKKKGNQIYFYYKCPKKGCTQNLNANKVNNKFTSELNALSLNKSYISFLSEATNQVFDDVYGFDLQNLPKLKAEHTKLANRIDRIEEDYYDDKISEERKNSLIRKSQSRIDEIETELDSLNICDKSTFMDSIIKDLEDLPELWENVELEIKNELQSLFFDKAIFNKENNEISIEGILPIFNVA